jgi:hypothetical protein
MFTYIILTHGVSYVSHALAHDNNTLAKVLSQSKDAIEAKAMTWMAK